MLSRTSQEAHPLPYPPQLDIARRDEPGGVTLIVRGEVDLATALDLDRELRDAERLARRISLDLAALEFIDSAGIHVLIDAHRRAEVNGHQLVLTRVPDHARRLFRLTGIHARLTIV